MPFAMGTPYGQFPPQFYGSPGQYANIRPRPYYGPGGQSSSIPDPSQWQQNPMAAPSGLDPSHMQPMYAAQHPSSGSAPVYMASYPVMAAPYAQVNVQPDPGEPHHYPGAHYTVSTGSFEPAVAAGYPGMASSASISGPAPGQLPPSIPGAPNPISDDGNVWNPRINAYDSNLYSTIPADKFDFTETVLEDELFDVDSDEEMGEALGLSEQTGLPLMMSVHGNFNVRALRSHDTFLNTPNILASYEPQWHASPLMNPTTARIFGHFIAVTACHLSLGQRRASNPSLLFQQNPVPKSQQGLWTYILPQKALSNQGLMHAILALASLQIAMLQGTDRHTARKHYHFAIRRNGKAVGLPKKRTSVATIATTLLLACFEVWAADHSNWNSHLVGARQLFLEIDFKGRTKRIRKEKGNLQKEDQTVDWNDQYAAYLHKKARPSLQADMPDTALLEKIMGYRVPFGDETVIPEEENKPEQPLTQTEIDTYDMYSDLWWFYVKQDIYYSTISSNPLLLPYSRWGDCPPRAPLGRIDAIYGTMDHLLLVIGRVAKFVSSDLARKKKAVEANGGRWKPPPGMFPGGPPRGPPGGHPSGVPPQGGPGPPRTPTGPPSAGSQGPPSAGAVPPQGIPSPQGPGFMGMIPDPPTPRIPAAFKDMGYLPVQREEEEISDLSTAFNEAMQEWTELQSVLGTFEAALAAPEWQPLPITAAPPIATHFGSALQYGDYRIADIWAMFYAAKIIMARVHPAMPPAALIAAGICAGQTAEWAQTIGKIVFGMQVPASGEPLNPTFASVLTQNMFCLFFAGVQFREAAQRLVTVQRLQYIAEKVGHESSALIAAALETCWVNAFQVGRGPEWRRVLGLAIDAENEETRKKEFRTMDKTKEGTTIYIKGDKLRKTWGMGVLGLESDFSKISTKGKDGDDDEEKGGPIRR